MKVDVVASASTRHTQHHDHHHVFLYTYVGHHRLERRRLERRRLEHRRLPHAADASSATLPREHRRLERRRLVCRRLERRRLVHRRCCESRRESIVTRRGYANSGRTRLWHHHRACGRVMCAACWSCFCIWQPSAVLSSVSPLQKAWSARMNVNARGDDSYCSEHCVAPTRVVGEHGLSGSGRRLAIVTAKRYARWTRPTGADVIGPGKVSHIHSTTRFPFRDMATVIEISRSGESTRGHAATRNENYRKLHPTHMCGLAPPHHAPTRSGVNAHRTFTARPGAAEPD